MKCILNVLLNIPRNNGGVHEHEVLAEFRYHGGIILTDECEKWCEKLKELLSSTQVVCLEIESDDFDVHIQKYFYGNSTPTGKICNYYARQIDYELKNLCVSIREKMMRKVVAYKKRF